MKLSLVLLVLAFSAMAAMQAPAPGAPRPAPGPPPSGSPSGPPSASLPPGPPPLPLTPKDPASLAVLTRLIESEKKLIAERDENLKRANELQSRITGLDSAAQDEISEIKKAEGWGQEVSYDGEKERFERAAKQGGAAPPSTTAPTKPAQEKK
jgi:hypothetical protein